MANSRGISIAAATVLVAGLLWLGWGQRTPRPPFDPQPHHALGQVMAEEALQLLGPEGRLIVFARDYHSFDVPAAKAQADGFWAAVKAAGRRGAVTNLLQLDPLRSTGVPADGLLETARRARPGDVLVLFLRPPELTEAQMQRLSGSPAKVVALCAGNVPRQVPLRALLARGVIHKAIISRPVPQAAPGHGAPARRWFEAWFEVATPERLESLPEPG